LIIQDNLLMRMPLDRVNNEYGFILIPSAFQVKRNPSYILLLSMICQINYKKKGIQINSDAFFLWFYKIYNENAALTASTWSNFSQVNNSTSIAFSSPLEALNNFVTTSLFLPKWPYAAVSE
jgi:hypothetical protein